MRTLWTHRDFRVVVVCSMLMGLGASFVMPFHSLFATAEVGMTLAVFGGFMVVTTLSTITITTLLSQRSDSRYSRRSMLLASSLCGSLGYVGYAFSRDLWVLLAISALVLGVASLTFPQLFAYARDLVDRSDIAPGEAPLYMSAVRMCFALSWTVGPALAALTLAAFSYEGLFLVAAALHATFFLVVLKFVPAAPRAAATVRGHATSLRGLLLAPGVPGWFTVFVFMHAAHTINMGNMALYVTKDLAGTEAHVGTIFGLAPMFELPLMLYFGMLATRVQAARLIRGAVVLAVAYYTLLSLARAPWHIYPLQVLSAAIVAVTGGVAITFFQDKLPGQSGAATNLYASAMRAGSTSGYLLFGALASYFGHRDTYVACAGLALAALALSVLAGRARSVKPVVRAS